MNLPKKHFNAWANNYDSYHPKTPHYNKFAKAMLQKANIKNDHDVLDIGIGTGYVEFKLLKNKRCRITGTDISDKMVNIVKAKNKKEKLDLKVIQQNAKDINFKKNSFDVVISCLALHHLKDKEKQKTFRNIYNSLKECGRFVLADIVIEAQLGTKQRLKEVISTIGSIGLAGYEYAGERCADIELRSIYEVYFQKGEFETSSRNLKRFFKKAGFKKIGCKFVNRKLGHFLIWGEK